MHILTFDNAASAVRFADGLLNDPHVKISMRQKISSGNYVDLRSLAETISLELERVPKPAGPMFRFVHGRIVRIDWIADRLVKISLSNVETNRRYAECINLAFLSMEKKRRQINGDRLTITEIARQLHVTRRVFYDQMFELHSAMINNIDLLLSQADNVLTYRLQELGIIGGD